MNIIVAGAGEFGRQIALKLSKKKHNVCIIDKNEEKIRLLKAMDVEFIHGESTDYLTLEKAGIKNTDLFIASTSSDEINLISCYFANKISPCKKVARIRNLSLHHYHDTSYKDFGVDLAFNPDRLAVLDLLTALKAGGAFEMIRVWGKKLYIKGYTVTEESWIKEKSVSAIKENFDFLNHALILTILRGEQLIYPDLKTEFKVGDKVHVLAMDEVSEEITKIFVKEIKKTENIFIVGINNSTEILLQRLTELNYNIKIFSDLENELTQVIGKFNRVSGYLYKDNLIETLEIEGIEGCEAFIASSKDEDLNIVSCLMAKQYPIEKIIIFSDKVEYLPFIQKAGIDIMISPELSTLGTIMRFTDPSSLIHRTLPLALGKAEVYRASIYSKSQICGKQIQDISIPKDCIISLIFRKRELLIPKGKTKIENGDILFFTTHPDNLKQLKKFNS